MVILLLIAIIIPIVLFIFINALKKVDSKYQYGQNLRLEDEIMVDKDFVFPTFSGVKSTTTQSSRPIHLKSEINVDENILPERLYYSSFIDDKDSRNYADGRYESNLTEDDKITIKIQTSIMALYIKKSMKHYWDGYTKCAYGFDEVKPCSCVGLNSYGGVGVTILENLDTLFLMDMKEELNKAEEWVYSLT